MSELHCHKKMHAELMAINKVKHKPDLSRAQIVIYAETKSGTQVLGKSCDYCHESLKLYGIKDVIYSSRLIMVTQALCRHFVYSFFACVT